MRMMLFSLIALSLHLAPAAQAAPKKLLLVGQGPDGHPAATHEYLAGVKVIKRLLDRVPGLEVTVVNGNEPFKDGPELLARADGVVLFVSEGGKWLQKDPARLKALLQVVKRGGGVSVLHWGMGTKDAENIAGCLQLCGGCHGGPDRKYKVVEAVAEVAKDVPITQGLDNFKVKEEFYYKLKLTKEKGLTPVVRVPIDGELETVCWAWERPGGGRAFGFSGLHFHDNWKLPEYRRLIAQGVLWTLKMPIPKEGVKVDVPEAALKLK